MTAQPILIKMFGGSRDGQIFVANYAPDFLEMKSTEGWIEIYERENGAEPFIYAQIGYAREEYWRG